MAAAGHSRAVAKRYRRKSHVLSAHMSAHSVLEEKKCIGTNGWMGRGLFMDMPRGDL